MDFDSLRALEGEMGLIPQPNLSFELGSLLLDTEPHPLHAHLEHILKFESGQLFSSHNWFVSEESTNGENPVPNSSNVFLPFAFPDSVVSLICGFLDPITISSLEITCKAWKFALRRGFLGDLEKEWLVPVKSRKMIEELTSALDSSMLRFGYEWKQVWRYLESIKGEIGIVEAIHEQLIALIGFSHFSLISDFNDPEFDTYQKETVEWVRLASHSVVDSIMKLRFTSQPEFSAKVPELDLDDAATDLSSISLLLKQRAHQPLNEALLKAMLEKFDHLLVQWAIHFCKTLFSTHIKPSIGEYHDILSEKLALGQHNSSALSSTPLTSDYDNDTSQADSFERSMLIIGELVEVWRKVKSWTSILNSLAIPYVSQLFVDPTGFPTLFGAPLLAPKATILEAIKEHIWTTELKTLVFSVSLALSDDLILWQQDMSSNTSSLRIQAVTTAFDELKPFFEIVSEPALSSIIYVGAQELKTSTETRGSSFFRLPSRQYVRLRTIEGSQFRITVSHAMRFSSLSHLLERATMIGCRFGDDELDEIISLEDYMVMPEDFRIIHLFSTFMDSIPAEYVEQPLEDTKNSINAQGNREEGIKEASKFLAPFLTSPRVFAALLLASRHLQFTFLTDCLQSFLGPH